MLINVFIHRTSIIYCAIHINAYITWGMMLIHTSPASWFLFFVVLQWEAVLIAWCQSDDVWGSVNNNKNTVTQTASTEMLTLVSPGILSFGEVEGELARGETSLLSSARGWTAAAGVETKKCTYIWMLQRQETVHLILHLKMGFFSITWPEVQRCLMVQGLMWRFWSGYCSSFSPRPCDTPCCQRRGIAAAHFQLLVAPQSLNQLIFGAGDCQAALLQFRLQLYNLTDDESTRSRMLKHQQAEGIRRKCNIKGKLKRIKERKKRTPHDRVIHHGAMLYQF